MPAQLQGNGATNRAGVLLVRMLRGASRNKQLGQGPFSVVLPSGTDLRSATFSAY